MEDEILTIDDQQPGTVGDGASLVVLLERMVREQGQAGAACDGVASQGSPRCAEEDSVSQAAALDPPAGHLRGMVGMSLQTRASERRTKVSNLGRHPQNPLPSARSM